LASYFHDGGGDLAGRLDAVELGHPEIHEDDVGAARPGQAHGLAPVTGLPDDVDFGLGGEKHPEAGADQGLVVDEQNPNGHHAGS
jgi:hypothetical protein